MLLPLFTSVLMSTELNETLCHQDQTQDQLLNQKPIKPTTNIPNFTYMLRPTATLFQSYL